MNQILSLRKDPGAAVLYHADSDCHQLIFTTTPGRNEESAVIFLSDEQLAQLRAQIIPERTAAGWRVSA